MKGIEGSDIAYAIGADVSLAEAINLAIAEIPTSAVTEDFEFHKGTDEVTTTGALTASVANGNFQGDFGALIGTNMDGTYAVGALSASDGVTGYSITGTYEVVGSNIVSSGSIFYGGGEVGSWNCVSDINSGIGTGTWSAVAVDGEKWRVVFIYSKTNKRPK